MNDPSIAGKAPLDEVMLAMDVVDTLRHRERVIERALSADDRDHELIVRLKEIYAGQGIEVSDAVIERGVRDLREDRFTYMPPLPSFGRTLARAYVSRGRWGPAVSLATAIVATILVSYQLFVRGPALEELANLPTVLEQSYAAASDAAGTPEAEAQAETIFNDGRLALERDEPAGARVAIAALETLSANLNEEYDVRVRSAPGELSGVWRVPDANPNAQNFYLIVEAIDADGNRLVVPIVNEETGRVSRVNVWGQRVDETTFRSIADDKQDDGIIQNAVIGEKRRGELDAEFIAGVRPGAITRW